jgi:hypothetical protein
MKPTLQVVDVIATPGHKATGFLVVPGTNVRMPLTLINGVNEGATLLITAGVHGGEYPSIEATIRVDTLPSGWTRAQVDLFCFSRIGERCTIHMVLCRVSVTAPDGGDTGNSGAAYVLDGFMQHTRHIGRRLQSTGLPMRLVESFVASDAPVSAPSEPGVEEAHTLMAALGIAPAQLIEEAYVDLLAQQHA